MCTTPSNLCPQRKLQAKGLAHVWIRHCMAMWLPTMSRSLDLEFFQQRLAQYLEAHALGADI